MRFEWTVALGAKGLKADIVVIKEGLPWIVVECKEPGHAKHDKAKGQGLGYAGAADVRAPYCLYTNGTEWLAYRKVNDLWLEIDDLPPWDEIKPAHSLVDILDSFHRLKPILYKLDEPIAGPDARRFLEHLQNFFVQANPLLRSVDDNVINGADHILRVMIDKTRHIDYRVQKMTLAYRDWEGFRSRRGIGNKIEADFDERFRPFLSTLQYDLDALLPHLVHPLTVDAQVLRLCIALLAYAVMDEDDKRDHVPITPAIHRTLRDFLDTILAEKFHCQLPDILNEEAISRMKSECRHAWDEYAKTGG